jgi:hypothetical protein
MKFFLQRSQRVEGSKFLRCKNTGCGFQIRYESSVQGGRYRVVQGSFESTFLAALLAISAAGAAFFHTISCPMTLPLRKMTVEIS